MSPHQILSHLWDVYGCFRFGIIHFVPGFPGSPVCLSLNLLMTMMTIQL
jgi:hypothetical protein